jgi:cystathionine gamma-synthase
VPLGDYDALEAAIRPETRVLLSETPSNPYLRILDVERFAEIGKRRGVLTVIDSTFATPINLRPLEWGVDLITHSATKYLGGHNDLMAGFIAGRAELIDTLRDHISILGGISDPNTAYLLLRGMKTLGVRVERQSKSAMLIAKYLARHPKVARVHFPGLSSHPDHALAKRQMSRFGSMMAFDLKGGLPAARKFCDRVRIFLLAASLGGVESLAILPIYSSHYRMSIAELRAAGVEPGTVRISVGLEDPADLIEDLRQALL